MQATLENGFWIRPAQPDDFDAINRLSSQPGRKETPRTWTGGDAQHYYDLQENTISREVSFVVIMRTKRNYTDLVGWRCYIYNKQNYTLTLLAGANKKNWGGRTEVFDYVVSHYPDMKFYNMYIPDSIASMRTLAKQRTPALNNDTDLAVLEYRKP